MSPAANAGILATVPTPVLEAIAFELVAASPLGPPAGLLPLLQSCRYLYSVLSFDNCKPLYARIFRFKFDYRAPARRIGPRTQYSSSLAAQLRSYSLALQAIRANDVHMSGVNAVLWQAFLMACESDGRNEAQLRWAGLQTFVYNFVRKRLWEGREASSMWPGETTPNALALWLLWFTTDQETVAAEGPSEQAEILRLLRPYVITALRYPAFHAPDNHFEFPFPPAHRDKGMPHLLMTPHGFYPLYRDPRQLEEHIVHYNLRLTVQAPLITVAAKLLYFSRLDRVVVSPPDGCPPNRAAALALGLNINEPNPTVEDYEELNAHRTVQLPRLADWDWREKLSDEQGGLEDDGVWRRGLTSKSATFDNDWHRLNYCWDPWQDNVLKGVVYTYGTLTGLWQGRAIVPEIGGYFNLVNSTVFPSTFSSMNPMLTMQPIFMNLREHHCINPEIPVDTGGTIRGFDDGVTNAWFPPLKSITETARKLTIKDIWGRTSTYETYVEGKPNSHSPETCTQCIHWRKVEEEAVRCRVSTRLRRQRQQRQRQKEEEEENERMRVRREREREREEYEVTERATEAPELMSVQEANALRLLNTVLTVPVDDTAGPRADDGNAMEENAMDENAMDVDEDLDINEGDDGLEGDADDEADEEEPHAHPHPHPHPHHERNEEWREVAEAYNAANEALGDDMDVHELLAAEMGPLSDPEDVDSESEGESEGDEVDDEGDEDVVDGEDVDGDDEEGDVEDEDEDEEVGNENENENVSDAGSDWTDYVDNTCNGILDIIITGETLPRHGAAWGHWRYYGRVRRWDGLVALLRYSPREQGRNMWIFRGYVVGGANFVGSWRVYHPDIRTIPLEGPFVLSRVPGVGGGEGVREGAGGGGVEEPQIEESQSQQTGGAATGL